MKNEIVFPEMYKAEIKQQENFYRASLSFIKQEFGERLGKVILHPLWNSRENCKEPAILLCYELNLTENPRSLEMFKAFHEKLNQLYNSVDFSKLRAGF